MGLFHRKKKEVHEPMNVSSNDNALNEEDLMNVAGGLNIFPEELDLKEIKIGDVTKPNS